ncbi:unnamed protein product [Protopolystoma xenopodis]|uniref:Uncharacterized protein n=1 Tax=Protopolystoma xenopodis TaxID=117903 RepID=A0A3S4ZQT1_9PLAT|nr:unnamed protein product [Protopolystoma xenopodis]
MYPCVKGIFIGLAQTFSPRTSPPRLCSPTAPAAAVFLFPKRWASHPLAAVRFSILTA